VNWDSNLSMDFTEIYDYCSSTLNFSDSVWMFVGLGVHTVPSYCKDVWMST
jgi:hypothetical protein